MAILKLIRKGKAKIIDRRSDKGICYKAKCEICGGIFYPSRSDAKYCSTNCLQKAKTLRNKQNKAKKPAVSSKSKK